MGAKTEKGFRLPAWASASNAKAWPPALYLALSLFLCLKPWKAPRLVRFDRILGQATAAGLSAAGRISGAFLLAVLFCALTAVCTAFCRRCMADGTPGTQKLDSQLCAFGMVALCSLVLTAAASLGTGELRYGPQLILQATALFCLLLWRGQQGGAGPHALPAGACWGALLAALAVSLPLRLLLAGIEGLTLPALYAVLAFGTLAVCLWADRRPAGLDLPAVQRAGVPLLFCMPVLSLLLELRNILNQHGVFTGGARGPAAGVCAAAALLGFVLYVRGHKHGVRRPAGKRLWYPVVLTGTALLANQPALQTLVDTDFFEQANGAVSISGLLRFGQLPVIETHGAHMFSDYLWGILWGLFNGNVQDACFLGYTGLAAAGSVLIFYELLKRCTDEDTAFLAALLLPTAGGWWSHLSFLPALALLAVQKKNTVPRLCAFWLLAAGSVLYQGDVGLAVGGASVLVLAALTLYRRRRGELRRLVLTGAGTAALLALVFAALCLAKGAAPLARLNEFLQSMAFSNQNWAYETVGQPGTAAFAVLYYALPALLAAAAAVLAVRLHRGERCTGAHLLFAVFTTAFFLNFPRILVRHSLLEGYPVSCLGPALWALPLAAVLLWNGRAGAGTLKAGWRLPVLMFCMLILAPALYNGTLPDASSPAQNALSTFDEGRVLYQRRVAADGTATLEKSVDETVPRAVLSAKMTAAYAGLSAELNRLLAPGESWLDLTNQSLLYALLGRENPVYVNQSPGLLSGDASQKAFVAEAKARAARLPVALLPQQNMKLGFVTDGIQNTLRYYRAAEYVYNHYVPYETVNGFAVWVRKDLAEDLRSQAQAGAEETAAPKLKRKLLQLVDCTGTSENGVLTLKTGQSDPQVLGLERALDVSGVQAGSLSLELRFTTDTPGTLQLFYAGGKEEFTEDRSFTLQVTASGEQSVRFDVPWQAGERLRLDPPSGAVFTLSGFGAASGGSASAVPCDYTYAAYGDAHNYAMGDIALLWGEKDTARAAENPELPQALSSLGSGVYAVSEKALGGENGRYLRFDLTAEEDSAAVVRVGRRAGYAVDPMVGFHFNVAAGTHTYLIRVSCDSYWYSGLPDGVQIVPEDGSPAFSVAYAAVLEGD